MGITTVFGVLLGLSAGQLACATAAADIWILGATPFTGGIWDAGESARVAGDMMAKQINDDGLLLPGYRLGILWQNDLCRADRLSNLLMDNLFKNRYYVYPDLPHVDLNGDFRISTSETLHKVQELVSSSIRPVGLLAASCSSASKAVIRWAYSFGLTFISSTNTDPDLSDWGSYPNFFRVISHEGSAPAAFANMIRVLGLRRAIVVVGTLTERSWVRFLVSEMDRAGVTLVGRDLSTMFPGLYGVQLLSEVWSMAVGTMRAVKRFGARIVIPGLWSTKLHLLICAQAVERFSNLIFLVSGYDSNLWMTNNYNQAPDIDICTTGRLLGFLNGMVIFQSNVWQRDETARLSCSANMSVGDFRREYFESQGAPVGEYNHVPDNYTIMLESAATADAVCMFAMMLRDVLFVQNHSLADLQARTDAAYRGAVDALSRTNFTGLQGQVSVTGGSGDVAISKLEVFQLQARRSPCAGQKQCGDPSLVEAVQIGDVEGDQMHFIPGVRLRFHQQDEVYTAQASGGFEPELLVLDFEPCPPGSMYNPDLRTCQGCANNTLFVSALGACVCAQGFVFMRSEGGCVPCAPGNYSPTVDAPACLQCNPGTFAALPGSSRCDPCLVGRYTPDQGSSECTRCFQGGGDEAQWWTTVRVLRSPQQQTEDIENTEVWTYAEGADSASYCACDKGARNQSNACVSCGEGLSCPGMNEVLVLPGYYSDVSVSVYTCNNDIEKCVGGPPGAACSEGRLGVSCAECEAGKAPVSGGTCQPCKSRHFWMIALVCSAALLVLALAYVVIGRPASRNSEVLTLMTFMGLLLTAVQVFSVVGTFQLLWKEPLKTALDIVSFLGSLNLEVFQIGCLQLPPTARFILKVTIIFAACGWLSLVHCIAVCVAQSRESRMHVLKSVLGTILMSFYITVVSGVLTPLQCEDHPNGRLTVRDYPSVLCWESEEHFVMVVAGISAFASIALPLIARCIWVVRQFPARMGRSDTIFLQENNYLFFRFRPEIYWYSLLILLRSLLCASLLVVPSVVSQVAMLQIIIGLSLLIGLQFRPWRIHRANLMETGICVLITGFCSFACFLAESSEKDRSVLSHLCALMVACVIAPFPLYPLCLIGYKLLRSTKHFQTKKRFQFFLCHHKAGAGAFTRLLKQTLLDSWSVTREVFVDSDNLESLTALFNTVAGHTETLVVIASHNIFRRPWCVGEMTIARWYNLDVLLVQMPDVDMPSPEFIVSYGSQVMELESLAAEGIGLEDIQTTLRWTHSLEKMELAMPFQQTSVIGLAAQLCGEEAPPPQVQTERNLETCLLCDWTHLETVASAFVLQKLMVPLLHESGTSLGVLGPDEHLPPQAVFLVVLLSAGLLEQDPPLLQLVAAVKQDMRLLPVTLEDAFRFPSQAALEELRYAKGDEVAGAVTQTVKEISVPFQPQHASLDTLQLHAKEVVRRLNSANRESQASRKTGQRSSGPAPTWTPTFSGEGQRRPMSVNSITNSISSSQGAGFRPWGATTSVSSSMVPGPAAVPEELEERVEDPELPAELVLEPDEPERPAAVLEEEFEERIEELLEEYEERVEDPEDPGEPQLVPDDESERQHVRIKAQI